MDDECSWPGKKEHVDMNNIDRHSKINAPASVIYHPEVRYFPF